MKFKQSLSKNDKGSNDAEIEEILNELAEHFPDFRNVKSSLNKIRNKNQPPLAQKMEDVNLEGNKLSMEFLYFY